MLLEGKVAVIYGAGGAVGRAVALAFAREGATLFLTGRHAASVERLAREIAARSHGKRLSTLTEMASVAAFMASDRASGMTGTVVNLSLGALDD